MAWLRLHDQYYESDDKVKGNCCHARVTATLFLGTERPRFKLKILHVETAGAKAELERYAEGPLGAISLSEM
jgi:hypothetical protein